MFILKLIAQLCFSNKRKYLEHRDIYTQIKKYDIIGLGILKYERSNLHNIRCLSQHVQQIPFLQYDAFNMFNENKKEIISKIYYK
jgi:hypothetical protein